MLASNVEVIVHKTLNIKKGFSITKESIVDVEARVSEVSGGVAGCTQKDIELLASQIWVISASAPQLPLQIDDASRPEKSNVIKQRLQLRYCLLNMLLGSGSVKNSRESRHEVGQQDLGLAYADKPSDFQTGGGSL